MPTRDGSVWFHGRFSGKFYRFNPKPTWTYYSHPDSLQGGFETDDGSTWFHTNHQAVQFKNNTWIGYGPDDGFLDGHVASLFQTSDSTLWFLGRHKGQPAAVRYNGRTWQIFTEDDGVIDRFFLDDFYETKNGNIWMVGAHNGKAAVAKYDGQTWHRFSEADGLIGYQVGNAFEASDGSLWFGTHQVFTGITDEAHGIYRYDGKTWHHYTVVDGLAGNFVTGLGEWPQGTLWVGTSLGISRLKLSDFPNNPQFDNKTDFNILSPKPQDFLPTPDAMYFLFQPNRNAGIVRYDGETWQVINSTSGLASDAITHIHRTSDGTIYFIGRTGLTRFNGNNWAQMIEPYQSIASPGGSVLKMHEMQDGSFWISKHLGGVLHYNHEDIATPETELEPAIDQVSSAGNILLQWSGIDLWAQTPRENLLYEWRIDKGNWKSAGKRTDITLTSLTSGDHAFEIRAQNSYGKVDPTPAVHAFIVEAPWWKNPYVIAIAFCLIGLTGLQTSRLVRRDQRLREANEELVVDAALERVRAQALGMQKSEDIAGVEMDIDLELQKLELPVVTSFIAVFRGAEIETWSKNDAGVSMGGRKPRSVWEGQSVFKEILDHYADPPSQHTITLQNEAALRATTDYIDVEIWDLPEPSRSDFPIPCVLCGTYFAEGVLLTVNRCEFSEGEQAIIHRFGQVFQLAYQRMRELENAEAQTRAAERRAAVDRVRAEAMSMRQAGDLEKVVVEVLKELSNAGITFNVCSVMIVDEAAGVRRSYNATSSGLTGQGENPLSEASEEWMAIWKKGKPTVRHRETVSDKMQRSMPSGSLAVLDAPFAHGTFAINRVGDQGFTEEEIDLVAAFADVISLGYTRYLDFQKLEIQNQAMSEANKDLFTANQELQRDRAVARIRAEVQSMDKAEDFEKILTLVTEDLKTVGLAFDACEIDLLNEPIDNPTMDHFESDGFRYTTYTLDPEGHVATETYNLIAPFPTVIRQTIDRFIKSEPWHGRSDDLSIIEVAARNYGRLRLTSSTRDTFTTEEATTLQEFANAIALGYTRYIDIRTIQEQTERKSAMLASMSHELRTPMNAIKGFANLVRRREPGLSDRGRENLEKVDQASDHLLAMINDLLDLSKIEAGRMDVNPSQFDVEKLINSCVSTVGPLVQDGVVLNYEVQSEINEAHTDEARLRQMVINLASNAIKFTDSGRVEVKAKQEGDQLVLSVSDTGKGIPEDELPTIFDEYRQVKGSNSMVQKGTGLGLSITKKFAELLGGAISVASEIGIGSHVECESFVDVD